MTKIQEIYKLGQSIWYDYIQKSLMSSGKLQNLIDQGLSGMTSNPTIFDKAISGSSDYDSVIIQMVEEGKTIEEIYDRISLGDIASAADLLRPVYERTDGKDGFVSIEVSPRLAHNTKSTCKEAKRIFETLNRPNIMIKVPATDEGFPAIKELLGSGVNINVTLIFSLNYYKKVARAFTEGLQYLVQNGPSIKGGQPINKIASVASFFVSRVDTYFDKELDKIKNRDLLGKIANANAKAAYAEYQNIFNSNEWKALKAEGARPQRLLWASTSTKNPAYHKLLYINELIGPNTVNTVPPETYDLILTEAEVISTLTENVEEAQLQLAELKNLGINYDKVTHQLLKDGIESFTKSFESLISSLSEKSKKFKKKTSLNISPVNYKTSVELAANSLSSDHVIERIWKKDYTLWKKNPAEIINRLGWLESPDHMLKAIPEIDIFVNEVRQEGFTHALLMGMGGSSLAPEVFRRVFGVKAGYLDLSVLDSTDAAAVTHFENHLDLNRTLFIVSTKSGGTVETLSFAKYFYNRLLQNFDQKATGNHFVAITDKGSNLEKLAKQLNFKKIFFNDPDVGGRFSALTHFGLVPAALIGVDLIRLLNGAWEMKKMCQLKNESNAAALLGAILGDSALLGKDKTTFLVSPQISSFVSWVEQLIAESSGKEGKGILPVEVETTENIEFFSTDRIFIYIKYAEDRTYNLFSKKILDAGHPLIEIDVGDTYDLGKEYFRWEFATAVAGWKLKINPFDQPDVEAAKIAAGKAVAAFQEAGKLPELDLLTEENGIKVFANIKAGDLKSVLNNFLTQPGSSSEKDKGYIAIQAYLQPTETADKLLRKLRKKLLVKCHTATTFGYGPRFLHSTGQLHKGDAGKGRFIQIISKDNIDLPIPDNPGQDKSTISFNILKNAQSLGDRQALLDAGRHVLRVEIDHPVNGLKKLLEYFE